MRMLYHPIASQSITRREFIRLGGIGLAAALGLTVPTNRNLSNLLKFNISHKILDNINYTEVLPPNLQGRVLNDIIDVYDIPSFKGNRVNSYWRDWVLPITDVTIGKSEDSFNMVWYKVGDEGYVHSGVLQPVFTITNPVVTQIPEAGALTEVTVPFTDAHWYP
jgi:hypothetical protein